MAVAAFKESDHPRDAKGRFKEKGQLLLQELHADEVLFVGEDYSDQLGADVFPTFTNTNPALDVMRTQSAMRYTHDIYYKSIRAHLQGDEIQGDDVEEAITALDEYFAAVPPTKIAGVTYRGVNFSNLSQKPKIGEVIEDKSFTSTTYDLEIAEGFAERTDGDLCMVVIPEGSKVLHLNALDITYADNEAEILLPRNSRFMVEAIEDEGNGQRLIVLRLMPEDVETIATPEPSITEEELQAEAEEQAILSAVDFATTDDDGLESTVSDEELRRIMDIALAEGFTGNVESRLRNETSLSDEQIERYIAVRGRSLARNLKRLRERYGLMPEEDQAPAEEKETALTEDAYKKSINQSPSDIEWDGNEYGAEYRYVDNWEIDDYYDGEERDEKIRAFIEEIDMEDALSYTGDDYEIIRDFLVTGYDELGIAEPAVTALNAAFRRVKPTEEEGIVYRGANLTEIAGVFSEGQVVSNENFSSTSLYRDVAGNFAKENGGDLLEIVVPKGSKVLDLNALGLSSYPDENEVLLNRNERMMVESIKTNEQGQRVVRLRIMPSL